MECMDTCCKTWWGKQASPSIGMILKWKLWKANKMWSGFSNSWEDSSTMQANKEAATSPAGQAWFVNCNATVRAPASGSWLLQLIAGHATPSA